MGGESIKPIRKRIHVYFLMTAYKEKNRKSELLKLQELKSDGGVWSIEQRKRTSRFL